MRSWRSFGPRSHRIVMLHDDNNLSLPLTEPSFSTALGWAPSFAPVLIFRPHFWPAAVALRPFQ